MPSERNCSQCQAPWVLHSSARGLCQRCYNAAYRAAYTEELKAKETAYRNAHTEERKAQRKAQQVTWHTAHREEKKAKSKRYDAEHRVERATYRVAYDAKYPGRRARRDRVRRAARLAAYPELMRERQREYAHRRRVRLRANFVAPVSVETIWNRDRGICGICDRKVKENEASLDHILPVSQGGTHEPRNVRLAHIRCNKQRQHRGAAQLRLLE